MKKRQRAKRSCLLAAVLFPILLSSCALDSGTQEYEKGVLAYEKEEYAQAAGLFEEAIEQNKDRAEYYLYYGFTLIELGKYAQAAESFEKVIQEKELAAVRENNKMAYRGAGIAYYLAGDDTRAFLNFSVAAAIEELPELDEDIRTYLAKLKVRQLEQLEQQSASGGFWQSEEADEILRLYDELAEEYKTPELYRLRADFYMKLGKYESALEDFNYAIGAGDTKINTLLGKYQALCALGKEEESNEAIAQIAKISPGDDTEAMLAAIANFKLGEYSAANAIFLELYGRNAPEAVGACYYLAQIAMLEEDYMAAYRYLAEWEEYLLKQDFSGMDSQPETGGALWEHPENSIAGLYYQLTYCAMETGRMEQAGEYYQKLADLQDASYLKKQEKLYIVLLEQQGKWHEALERMEHYLAHYADRENAEEYAKDQKEHEFLKNAAK